MSDALIIAAVGQYSDGETVRTIGVSTARYDNHGIASTIDGGVFLPCLSADSLSWSEQIRHQPQGGTTSVQVSDLTLINTESTFDDWARYVVAGLTWTVKRGRPDQSWDEFETIFSAVGTGAPEFRGRTEMTIRLRDRFAALSQPVSQTVFDVDVPNERYANRLRPVVYGDVYQVSALVIDPAFFRVFAADNLAVIRRVTEGGRPTTQWFEVEDGYQVTQGAFGDTLPICADLGGPPVPDAELVDIVAAYGDFGTWAGSPAEPDGWVVYDEPADSTFTEDTTNGGALVTTTLVAGTSSDALNAGTVALSFGNSFQDATGFDTGGTPSTDVADWPAYLNADDAAYVALEIGGQFVNSQYLTLKNFSGAVASTKTITGVEVDIRAQSAGSGTADVTFEDVRLLFPNGSYSENKAADTAVSGTKTVYNFGASDDLWGTEMDPALVNSEGFGVWLRFRAGSGTVPVETRVFEVVLTVHHNDGSKTVRIYADTTTYSGLALDTGSRYRVRITYDDLGASPSDTLTAKWAAVDAIGDPIPRLTRISGSTGALTGSENYDDPNVTTQGILSGTGVLEGEFIADGPVFGIEFYPTSGQTGDQRIVRVELEEISIAVNTFKDLVRSIASDAGLDPDADIDNDALDAIATATGNPPLGWYVRNQTTRDQLLTLFAHSLASTVWGGIDGEVKAAMFTLPGQPASSGFLQLGPERNMGPSVSVTDEAPDLRDRVHAAQNIDPLQPNETAGITETWPETERQKVLADWRITERANFETIEAGTTWPIVAPDPAIDSITPATGSDAGGTSVTITVSNFTTTTGATVTVGGAAATNVTAVNGTTITCDTPAGTAGNVDVVVTVGAESATLSSGFEYTASGGAATQIELTAVGGGTWTVPAGVTSIDVILVAGGGGGGGNRGGGGGGGGVVQVTGHSVAPGASLSYSVGAGGAGGGGNLRGSNGGNTTFDTLTAAIGGGGGGGATQGALNTGGSGGGGGHAASDKTGGAATAGQGNAGGNAGVNGATSAGGGGGAGAVGQDDQGSNGGNGGAGIDLSAMVGTSIGDSGVFAGGGGGGGWNAVGGAGGSGGGGDGANQSPSAAASDGIDGTGGGGGGGTDTARTGGDGGSGIIIIRY